MANGKAPPHSDAGTTKGTDRALSSHEAAFRGRLSSNPVYKAPADTGSSGKMPTGRATDPLITGRNAKR